MKKISLISINLLFFFLSVFAQSTQYLSEFNRQQTTIVWQEKRINEKIYLYAMQEDERHEYIMNQSLQTEKWKIVNPLSQTDLTIELHGNAYWITGKFKGKPITKTVKSKGYIWYQNIAYNAGLSLKDKQEISIVPQVIILFHNGECKPFRMRIRKQPVRSRRIFERTK